ncbi:M56 family metallopeptidase [Paenibacillus sp. 1_12]|uniref:M56 family metallopeptidase n=1 Tax=Paenibacillus sp. 1_12 TaxID=1566278 RepID=UPI0015A54CC6|nr:M56 family metallopeptidase [Paenibacillus sp. 1_12]
MFIALSHQISDVEFKSGILLNITNMLVDVWIGHTYYETLFVLLIGLTCIRMFTYIYRQIHVSQQWGQYVKAQIHPQLTKKWTGKYKAWHTPIYVIREHQPVALAAGLLNPRIVISTGLLEMLSLQEIHAVLLHEYYHCSQRHPLKKWLAGMIIRSMPYVSILKGLGQNYDIWIELLADRYVITQTNSTYTIGTALLKLVQARKLATRYPGVSFSDSAINYRLSQLINPDQPIDIPMVSWLSVCFSSMVLIVISMIIIFRCV